jgi:hypothetical protein
MNWKDKINACNNRLVPGSVTLEGSTASTRLVSIILNFGTSLRKDYLGLVSYLRYRYFSQLEKPFSAPSTSNARRARSATTFLRTSLTESKLSVLLVNLLLENHFYARHKKYKEILS